MLNVGVNTFSSANIPQYEDVSSLSYPSCTIRTFGNRPNSFSTENKHVTSIIYKILHKFQQNNLEKIQYSHNAEAASCPIFDSKKIKQTHK